MKTFTFNGMQKNADNMYEIIGRVVSASESTDIDRLGSVANSLFLRALDMAEAAKAQGCDDLANIVYANLKIDQ